VNEAAGGYDMVAIGTSAGGLVALCKLIRLLPDTFETPIAIVQHRAKESEGLGVLLQDCTQLRVIDVEDKQPDYHLLIDDDVFALSTEGLVGYSRPSIDVFFDSVADAYGPRAIGVVLTGANADGSKGLYQIVARGGQALIQDPDEAEVAVMPASAKRAVPRARVMTLDAIAEHLTRLERLHDSQVVS
jgi:two-component system chemotaxis response regulator CheB